MGKQGVCFTTSNVVEWLDIFTRNRYLEIILDSIRFCQLNKGLQIVATREPSHFVKQRCDV